VPTILGWATGGALIALINLIFGTSGSLLDLPVPVVSWPLCFGLCGKSDFQSGSSFVANIVFYRKGAF
jgi:hypothetical protein